MIERIQKLEQSNRRMKKYMVSLHIILVGMFVVGFQSTAIPDVIEAKKLVIKDDKGSERIKLSITESGASTITMGEDSINNIWIFSQKDQNEIHLMNPKGSLKLMSHLFSSSLVMDDIENNETCFINSRGSVSSRSDDGSYELSNRSGGELFFYKNEIYGKKTFSLSSRFGKTNLSMYDNYENRRVSIGNQDMIDQFGNEYKSAVSSIHLFNQNNKTIFSAPN